MTKPKKPVAGNASRGTRLKKVPSTHATTRKASFPIIGIGASAGGLEAFELFFKTMPAESGMAFVLVPHLDPGHASMLSEILQRNTTMPVHEALDNVKIQPNTVYIIPPNKDMAIFHGAISLSVPELARGLRLPIDAFFRSLAEDQGERAICVILSGSGSDGTLGLRAIHGVGGVSFVQEPTTAKYDGMPSSAVHTGLATYVLPVEKITEQLVTYVKTIANTGVPLAPPAPAALSAMRRIMMLLRTKTGNDFSQYKQSTIRRRIERRMAAHNLADMDGYARYLAENPAEGQILFKELLINVTSFFRDKEAFEALNKEALPRLFADKPENYVFRIWVPGCASGEEAYSLVMLFHEYMDQIKQDFRLQIYATDIDDDAIASARAGTYPENIAIDVSPERLRQFFVKEGTGYRIKKDIRENVVFAIQNLIKDPPFTKMDLISCRNLLIYLDGDLQSRVIPAFHYALKPGGVLFLSPSESIGNFTDLFSPLDKKWKIFGVKPSLVSAYTQVTQRFAWTGEPPEKKATGVAVIRDTTNFAELTKRVLLQSFAPPSVITDTNGDIVYVHGDTGKYLQTAQGQPSHNVIAMAREGLQRDVRIAIQNAAAQKKPMAVKGLPVRINSDIHGVDLTVRPLAQYFTEAHIVTLKAALDGDEKIFEEDMEIHGKLHTFRIKVLPLVFDQGGKGIGAIFIDITGIKAYQHDLEGKVKERTEHLHETNIELERRIREYKKIEKALLESEEKYRALVDNITEVIFTLNDHGVITYISPAINPISGFSVDELLGRRLSDYVHSDDLVPFTKGLDKSKSGDTSPFEFRLVTNGGGLRWVHASGKPVEHPGVPAGYQGMITDIHEQKRAEDALRRANKQIVLLNSITRHDILNGITKLLAYLDIAKRQTKDAKLLELLDKEKEITNTIQRQISFTRDYQNIGIRPPQWQDIGTSIKAAAEAINLGNITLSVHIDRTAVFADDLIEKVFFNLMENSVQHGKKAKTITISLKKRGKSTILFYEDDGTGIAKEEKELIFEHSRAGRINYGLFFSREVLAITGLTIKETGTAGSGARFEITVPEEMCRGT
jgi:two-component system, chemotaxis family, CheB/CheR fusion protein